MNVSDDMLKAAERAYWGTDKRTEEFSKRMRSALEAALRLAVPYGFVVVPKDPTPKMLRAAIYIDEDGDGIATRDNWIAMLAAAPQVREVGEK